MRNTRKTNVNRWLALALPALLPVTAWAEPLALQAQGTAAPETVAVASVPALASTPGPLAKTPLPTGRILVLPFQATNPQDPTPWLGKSIQESMVADLTVAAPDRLSTTDQTAATQDAAIALGKQSGARYVVAGGFITVDRELRITGKVIDVETGKDVAGLKVTGDPSEIFRMEDALALQVRAQVLGQQITMPTEAPPAQQQEQPAPANPQQAIPAPPPGSDTGIVANPGQPAQYYSPYAVAPDPVVYGGDSSAYGYYPAYPVSYGYGPYYYPAYDSYAPYYSCDYGYYGGCYPFGFGFGFGTGFFFGSSHFHFHDHDHDHGHDFHTLNNGGFRSANTGLGVSISAGVRSSNFRGSLSVSPGIARSAARVTTGNVGTFRASAAVRSSSFTRASSVSGFRAGGGFSSHASFGGGMGSFHGGGGGFGHAGGGGGHAGGGGGHGGGGHR